MPIVLPPISAPGFGNTLDEMIEEVQDQIRNVSVEDKIIRWLNMAINDIAYHYVFGNLHAYNSVISAVGNPDAPLADDMYWLKTIEIPAHNRKLWPDDEARLSESNPDYRTLKGTITHYYINGTTLGLRHVPAEAVEITYSYQRRPLKLVDLADVCDLPPEWHNLVIQKAITRGLRYEGNSDGRDDSTKAEAALLYRLGANKYKRQDETVVIGNTDYRARPPRPSLPSNYPSTRY